MLQTPSMTHRMVLTSRPASNATHRKGMGGTAQVRSLHNLGVLALLLPNAVRASPRLRRAASWRLQTHCNGQGAEVGRRCSYKGNIGKRLLIVV